MEDQWNEMERIKKKRNNEKERNRKEDELIREKQKDEVTVHG